MFRSTKYRELCAFREHRFEMRYVWGSSLHNYDNCVHIYIALVYSGLVWQFSSEKVWKFSRASKLSLCYLSGLQFSVERDQHNKESG